MINRPPFILLVDDDEDDHYLIKSAIQEVLPEAKTQSLYDGTEALHFLTREVQNGLTERPDVIFMDLNMSKLNGMQTALVLKNDPDLKDIPIIILSTSSEVPEKEQLVNLVNGFYSKPNNSASLINIIVEVQLNFLSF